jgi:hypothetical protein
MGEGESRSDGDLAIPLELKNDRLIYVLVLVWFGLWESSLRPGNLNTR